MPKLFKQKSTIVFLAITAVGLLITNLIFPYYAFDWGIKPCQGLPTDAANCGDADLGGVIFMLIGVPIVAIGAIGLLASLVWGYIKQKR